MFCDGEDRRRSFLKFTLQNVLFDEGDLEEENMYHGLYLPIYLAKDTH